MARYFLAEIMLFTLLALFTIPLAFSFAPVSLRGTTLPEEKTVTENIIVNPQSFQNAILTMSVYDADIANEGLLYINGNGPVQLFGAQGTSANDNLNKSITFTTNASWWRQGNNSLRFVHTSTAGYIINSGNVSFTGSISSSMPTLNFAASPSSVAYNSAATLSWNAANVSSCTASGAWSGTKPLAGSESTGLLTASKTYMLTCTSAGGSATKSVTVSVGAAPVTVANSIALQPSSPSVLLGNEVRVDIVANNISSLAGIQASISYNPAVLRYERAQEGTFLKQGNVQTLFLDTIDTTTSGIIKNIAVVRIGSGASGSGIIASIYFRTISGGISDLKLTQVLLATSNGTTISAITLNASVNIVFSDADSDEVPDSLDRCPGTPPQYAVSRYGCPIPPGNFSPDLSTNLSDVDLLNFTYFKIGIRGVGELDFGSKNISLLENISGTLVPVNLSRVIEFSRNKITVRSELFRAFNTSATVTLALAGIANPLIYRNNFTCPDCRITSFTGGNLTFTVPRFTEYSIQEGSYCGDNFCSSLESCSLCSLDCGICQPPIIGGGGGGGSGGGGGGGSSTKTLENITVSYSNFDIFRVFVDFTSRKTISSQTTLSLDTSEILTTTSLPVGPVVYKAFNIKPTNFLNSEVQLAKIEFRVDKNWIKANNIDVDSIKLYRLVDTFWTPIYTVRFDETSYVYHFAADSTGFSIFAIGGSISTEPPEEPVQPPEEQIPIQAPPQTPAQVSSDMLGLVIIIVGVVVLIIVISKLKGRHKQEESPNPFLRHGDSE